MVCLQCSSDSGFLLGLSTSSCPTSIAAVFCFHLQDSEALILKLLKEVTLYKRIRAEQGWSYGLVGHFMFCLKV